jgi:hypothetical protein
VKFIGLARDLRRRIERDAARFEVACEALLKPLRPRPGWPAPTKLRYRRRA